MSNYQINTHTRVPVLASSTAFSIRTLMSCKYFLSSVKAAHATHTLSSSGSVCLDVINQTWSPMYDMINIFEVFLPQLLRYPNPSDPLNGEAAAMLMRDPKNYENKVRGLSLYPPFWIIVLRVLSQTTSPNTQTKTQPKKVAKTPSQKTN